MGVKIFLLNINFNNKERSYVKIFINSFIISFVASFVMLIPLNMIWQFVIGFAMLLALIYSFYEIYGRHLAKKYKKD